MIFTVASFAVEQCLTAGSGQRLTAILCYSIGIANGTCKTGVVGRFEHSWQLLVISRASGACIAIARMHLGWKGGEVTFVPFWLKRQKHEVDFPTLSLQRC